MENPKLEVNNNSTTEVPQSWQEQEANIQKIRQDTINQIETVLKTRELPAEGEGMTLCWQIMSQVKEFLVGSQDKHDMTKFLAWHVASFSGTDEISTPNIDFSEDQKEGYFGLTVQELLRVLPYAVALSLDKNGFAAKNLESFDEKVVTLYSNINKEVLNKIDEEVAKLARSSRWVKK